MSPKDTWASIPARQAIPRTHYANRKACGADGLLLVAGHTATFQLDVECCANRDSSPAPGVLAGNRVVATFPDRFWTGPCVMARDQALNGSP